MAAEAASSLPALVERAPAKINLTLHIRSRRSDGYHDLESLAAFAGVADTLRLEPGETLALRVDGPTAVAAGDGDDNLVLRAARNLAARVPGLRVGRFELTKRLPVAAGIGGGSSDAAAALRLLARLNQIDLEDPRLLDAARVLAGQERAEIIEDRQQRLIRTVIVAFAPAGEAAFCIDGQDHPRAVAVAGHEGAEPVDLHGSLMG